VHAIKLSFCPYRRLIAHQFVCIGQGPNPDFGAVDVFEKLSQARIELDHSLQRQSSVAFAVKVEGICANPLSAAMGSDCR